MAGIRHANNVSGDYYVARDCCTLCGVPWHVAPELFGYDDKGCWVSRQPVGSVEEAKMLDVIAMQELGCIRYCGTEKRTLHALAERGEQKQCDVVLRSGLMARFITWLRTSRS